MCSSIFVFFQALSVGIFPYVLKLLQSSARELRPLLVFIWAKILAVDSVSDLYDLGWKTSSAYSVLVNLTCAECKVVVGESG